jgi:hypothetical protein
MTVANASIEARVSYQLFQKLKHALASVESAPVNEKILLSREDVLPRPKMQCYVSSRAF